MGLESILSAEPLPRLPVIEGEDPEIDAWRRNIHNYLRRLMGRFTDENLPSGADVIWEHLDDTAFTINNTGGDHGIKTLRTVSIPGDTIQSGNTLWIEAWGHMPISQVGGSNWLMQLTLGGVVVADQTVAAVQGIKSEHWLLRGAISVGVDAWIHTPRVLGGAEPRGKLAVGGIDLTIDNDLTIDVDGPAATTSFSIDISHLRQAGTRTP